MWKKILFAFFGVILAIMIGAEVYRQHCTAVANAWRAGFTQGKYEAIVAIEEKLGKYDDKMPHKEVFHEKASSVVMVEINGVKTVRAIP